MVDRSSLPDMLKPESDPRTEAMRAQLAAAHCTAWRSWGAMGPGPMCVLVPAGGTRTTPLFVVEAYTDAPRAETRAAAYERALRELGLPVPPRA